MRHTLRTLALPSVALAAALTLTACGGTNSDAGSTSTNNNTMPSMGGSMSRTSGASNSQEHNAADVAFATDMIPHHAQAITMADMAVKTATNSEIKALATAIKAAQDPEIQTMSGWLKAWGQPVPDTGGGHNMSAMGGQGGMMSDQQMMDLQGSKGATFDRMWLQMMIQHHEGAIAMAKTELASGSSAEAKQLAQAIIDGQSKEIVQMKDLLATLPG